MGDLPGPLAGSHSLPLAGSCDRGDGALAGSPDRLGAQASQKPTAGSNHRGPDGLRTSRLRMRQCAGCQKAPGERCTHGHGIWLSLCGAGSQSHCVGEHLGRFPGSTLAVNCTAIGGLCDCRFAELAAGPATGNPIAGIGSSQRTQDEPTPKQDWAFASQQRFNR